MTCPKISACIGTLLLFGGAFAADTKTELQANYAAITAAFKKKDIGTIEKFLGKDFSVSNPNGKTSDRASIVKDYKMQMQIMKDVVWTRKITSIVPQGKNFLVTVDGNVTGIVPSKDMKPHRLQLVATAKDTWTKSGGTWQIVHTIVVKRVATVDGKPMPLK